MANKKDVQNIYTLSPLQGGMFFHFLYDKTSLAYFEQVAFTLQGEVDIKLFEDSWNEIFKRHEIFRTVFIYKNVPEPLQVVFKKRSVKFHFEDICHLNLEDQQTYLENFKETDRNTTFDLTRDVLMRVSLFKCAPSSFKFIWSFHHILMDGWCLGILQTEFFEIYKSLKIGKRPVLPPVTPYSHYIKWLKRQDKKLSEEYWTEFLKDYEKPVSIPKRHGDKINYDNKYKLKEMVFTINNSKTLSLNDLSKRLGITLNTAIQFMWAFVLALYNKTRDVVFAATVSGRPPEIEGVWNMVGLFINAIPVRVKFNINESLEDSMKRLQSDSAKSKNYHYYPLAEIQSNSKLNQELINHIFVFENYPSLDSQTEQDSNDIPFIFNRHGLFEHTHYDFEIQVIPNDEILFRIRFNSNVYDYKDVQKIETHVGHIIDSILEDSSTKLKDIRLDNGSLGLENIESKEMVFVSATFISEPVGDYIKWWCEQFNISVDLNFALYNQVFQELLDDRSAFWANRGINILLVRFEDWIRELDFNTDSQCVDHLEKTYKNFTSIIENVLEKGVNITMIIGIFPVSTHLGFSHSVFSCIEGLNNEWKEFIKQKSSVNLVDFSDIPTLYGIDEVFDAKKDKEGHMPFTDEYYSAIGTRLSRAIVALKGHKFKAIALDCDNTLWQGVCAEDGPDGVSVDNGFYDLQNFMVNKYKEGFLLTLCSKNNEKDVWDVFSRNSRMVLKKEHFVATRINWNSKSESIKAMARELNISVDSFIFIDDNNIECAEVMAKCPEALTLKLPESSEYFPHFLNHIWAFDRLNITQEDKTRGDMYRAEKERIEFKESALSLQAFLHNLDLTVSMVEIKSVDIPRASQLTQRTNQFNLSTIRRTENEIRGLMVQDGLFKIWAVHVRDKFGDYGIVGLVIAKNIEHNDTLFIDTFLMSCRVLGRGVEESIMSGLKEFCEKNSIKTISSDYIETQKNKPIFDFLEKLPNKKIRKDSSVITYKIYVNLLPEKVSHVTLYFNKPFNLYLEQEKKPENIPLSQNGGCTINTENSLSKDTSFPNWKVDLVNEENFLHKGHYLSLANYTKDSLVKLPVVSGQERSLDVRFVEPKGEVQEKLSSIWIDILGIDRVGVKDDFFALGGNSIKATMVVSKVHNTFGVEIGLKDFFDSPDIESLALLVSSKSDSRYKSIKPVEEKPYYDLSHSQKRLWVLNQIELSRSGASIGEGVLPAYNISIVYKMEGAVNLEVLQKAFYALIIRHESLRTTFHVINGSPVQKIETLQKGKLYMPELYKIKEIDISNNNQNKSIEGLLKKEIHLSFNLSTGPLVRLTLICKDVQTYYMVLVIHHIISDGWSLGVLERDLFYFYESFSGSNSVRDTLSSLEIHYKDYALWQNNLLKNPEKIEKLRKYWLNKFSDELTRLNFPLDYNYPKVQTFNGNTINFQLPERLNANILREFLHKSSGISGATLFMFLMCAVKILLYRYSGQRDITVGFPISGRNHSELDEQNGFYVNTLALRDTLDKTDTFNSLLRKIKQTTLEAYDNQLYPFDVLVDELGLERDTTRPPLFDVLVALQDTGRLSLDGNRKKTIYNNIKVSAFGMSTQTAIFPLTFNFAEIFSEVAENYDTLVAFDINYNTDLFKSQTIEQIGVVLIEIIENIVSSNGSLCISKFNILPDQYRDKVLEDFCNGPEEYYPSDLTIHGLFERQARLTPNNTAMIFEDNIFYTYKQLDEKANCLANYLIESCGINNGDLVGVMVDRGENTIISLLGVLKSGAVYLPVDINYPLNRIEYIIKDSCCKILLVEEDKEFFSNNIKAINILHIFSNNLNNKVPSLEIKSESVAYVIYTSGSTGLPKGVMVPHRGFINMSLWQIRTFGVTKDDKVLQFSSTSFDASLSEIFMALFCGGALVLISRENIMDKEGFLQYVEDKGVTVATLSPSYLNKLNRADMATIKTLITAGESPILKDVLHYSSIKDYFNAYGPTEASVCSTCYGVKPNGIKTSIPIGKPGANTYIYILDENLNPMPVGTVGQICIGGVGVTKGYLNKPELTEKAFVENPFNDKKGDKLYLTGDLGRWLFDGNIEFLGRTDGQIKVRGYRIEVGEIEFHIKNHPAVEDVVIISKFLGGTNELIAYFTKTWFNSVGIRDYLSDLLPFYMIPEFFIPVDELPLTINGKIDKEALAERQIDIESVKQENVEAEGETEKSVLSICEEVLGIKGMGMLDNFFDLGGNSLKALQVVSMVKKELDMELSVMSIFASKTIREVCRRLEERVSDIKVKDSAYYLLNDFKGKKNIFCFPPLHGNALIYKTLVDENVFYDFFNVYSFNFIDTFDVIKYYTETITNIQEKGPYVLLGYSGGGNIAFELSKRLPHVSDIVLLDSWIRHKELILSYRRRNEIIEYYMSYYGKELHGRIKDRMLKYLDYINGTVNTGMIDGNIHLIKSIDKRNDVDTYVISQSWDSLTKGRVYVYNGYGLHTDMLTGKNILKNGKIVRNILTSFKTGV